MIELKISEQIRIKCVQRHVFRRGFQKKYSHAPMVIEYDENSFQGNNKTLKSLGMSFFKLFLFFSCE